MSHEQSETVGPDPRGLFRNVFGRRTPQAGRTLPVRYPFEQPFYLTLLEALMAAQARSAAPGRGGAYVP